MDHVRANLRSMRSTSSYCFQIETRGRLIGKVRLAIAHSNDTRAGYFPNFLQMGVGDLAATDNGYA